ALPGAAFAAGDRVLARLRMRKSAAEEGVRVAQAALAPGRPLAVIAAAVGAVVHPDGGRVISAHVTSYRPDGSEALALPQRILRRSAGLGSGTYAGKKMRRVARSRSRLPRWEPAPSQTTQSSRHSSSTERRWSWVRRSSQAQRSV